LIAEDEFPSSPVMGPRLKLCPTRDSGLFQGVSSSSSLAGAKTYANYLALYVSTPDYFLNSLPADSADRGQKLPLVGMGSESLVQEKRYYLILGTAA